MTRPDNLDSSMNANPNWYSGTRWTFKADENGKYRLSLKAESGKGASIPLTDEQAASLLYAAQAGELDNYGDHI